MKNWKDECNYRRIKDENGVMTANVIMIDGQDIPVSAEVYEAYSQMGRQERYQEQLLLRLLPKAMEQLTESERELIRELFFEGISLREYCRINGIPTMTQHYRLQQVLKKLKNILS
jgi:RNA polymerase sigma factor (sigma-70 family)